MAVYGALDGGLHARGRGAAGAPPPYEVIIVAERGEAELAHFLTLWRAQPLFAFSLVDTPEAEGQQARAGMAVCWRSNQVWWLELPAEACDGAEGAAAPAAAAATGGAAEAGADAVLEGVRAALGGSGSKKICFGYSASLVRSLARRGVRVAPRVCDPQVAAALLRRCRAP